MKLMNKLTPLEKARMAKASKAKADKAETEAQMPKQNQAPKKEKPTAEAPKNLESKMDAILDKLPMIERCNNICNFLLDHYGLKKHFKELMDIESEARDKAELYRIFEHYGIAE